MLRPSVTVQVTGCRLRAKEPANLSTEETRTKPLWIALKGIEEPS